MNELLMALEIVIVFGAVVLVNKLLGKEGLIAWVGIASILAEIQLTKSVTLFGLESTLGNVLFASNFLATDILNECYSKADAKKAVKFGITAILFFFVMAPITLAFTPNGLDIANPALKTILTMTPRICAASAVMFYVSNLADVYLYDKFKQKDNEKRMWLRNNLCTVLCNCAENFGLMVLAFLGIYSFKDCLVLGLGVSVIEAAIALCDTPFLYLARWSMKGEKNGGKTAEGI